MVQGQEEREMRVFVPLHTSLSEKTFHLIGEKELSFMKSTAYLINMSRGPMIDEKALVKALQEKRIGGAGLDVYENEPELAPGLMECENVVLLPHLGSASFETREKMTLAVATNALALLKRESPEYRQPGSLQHGCLLEANGSLLIGDKFP